MNLKSTRSVVAVGFVLLAVVLMRATSAAVLLGGRYSQRRTEAL
jgi:hypothetical protein